jgi:hypothetical protein
MLSVSDPQGHPLLHRLAIDGAGAPAIAHAAETVAKTAHILLG